MMMIKHVSAICVELGAYARGDTPKKMWRGVRPLPKTLTLFMTKLCDNKETSSKKKIKARMQKLYPFYDQKGWRPNPLVLHISIYIPPAAHARICINVFMASQIYHEEVNYDVLSSFGTLRSPMTVLSNSAKVRLFMDTQFDVPCNFARSKSLACVSIQV